jgi:small subunit ribosomal protein S24e
MEVVKDFKNDLLKRREVKFVIESEKNPGFNEAVEKVASKFGANKDLILVNNIKSKFGRRTFLIDAFIYHSAEDRKKFEPKAKVKKAGEAGGAK